MSIVGLSEFGTNDDKKPYLYELRKWFEILMEGDAIHLLEDWSAGIPMVFEGDMPYVFDEHGPIAGKDCLFVTNAMFDVLSTDLSKIYFFRNFQPYKGMKVIIGIGDSNAGIFRVSTVSTDIFAVYLGTESFPTAVSGILNRYMVRLRIDKYMEASSTILDVDCRIAATSITSLTIGTGSKTLTVQSNLGLVATTGITIFNGSDSMTGTITTYTAGTGKLIVNITSVVGSGTIADWDILLSAYTLQNVADAINIQLEDFNASIIGRCTVYDDKLKLEGLDVSGNGTIVVGMPSDYVHDATRYLFGVKTQSSTSESLAIVDVSGSVSLTIESGLNIVVGDSVALRHDASNYMTGTIYSYDILTGELTIDVLGSTGTIGFVPTVPPDWKVFFTGYSEIFTSGLIATLDRVLSVVPVDGQEAYVLYPRLLSINDAGAIRENLRNTVNLARTKYGGRDFNTLIDEALSYIKFYYGDRFNDFYASDYGLMLVEAMAFMLDTMSFYLSFKDGENYMETARLDSSVARIARQLGYKANGAMAATADLSIRIPKRVNSPRAFYFGKGSKFTVGGKVFSLSNDVYIDGTAQGDVYAAFCFEGEISFASQIGSGGENQRIDLVVNDGKYLASNYSAESGGIKLIDVIVGGEEWIYVDFFSFAVDKQNAFEVAFTDSPPYVLFGDGVAGNKPPDGAKISVEYAVTSGVDGSAAVAGETASFDSIIYKTAAGDVASSDFISNTIENDYIVESILVTMTSVASGGSNPESIDSVRVNAPASFATARRAVTADDYNYFINTYSTSIKGAAVPNRGLEGGGEIETLIKSDFSGLETAINSIVGLTSEQKKEISADIASTQNQFTIELDGIVSESGKVNHVSVYIISIASDGSYVSPSDSEKQDVFDLLESVKMITTTVSVNDGVEFVISVDVLIGIKVKPYYDTTEVRNAAEEAIRNLLKDKNFGDDVFMSVAEDAVQSIAGVSYCDIQFIPYRVLGLLGYGNLNDPPVQATPSDIINFGNNNVVNGDKSWSEVYNGGIESGVVNVAYTAGGVGFASSLQGYSENYWNGARLTVTLTVSYTCIVVSYKSSGVIKTYPDLSLPDGKVFSIYKDFEFLKISNTSNAGFYEINEVRGVGIDASTGEGKSEVELGVSKVSNGGTKTDIQTGLNQPDNYWTGALMKYVPTSPPERAENGPDCYRKIQGFTNASGVINLNAAHELSSDPISGDEILVYRRGTNGLFLNHILQNKDDGIGLVCALASVVRITERCGVNADAISANQVKFLATTKPRDWWNSADKNDFLFVKDPLMNNYGIYTIVNVEVIGLNTVVTVSESLPDIAETGMGIQYLRVHGTSSALRSAALIGVGNVDTPNTDEIIGNSEWYDVYNEKPPEDVLIPIEGLAEAYATPTYAPTSFYFRGAESWKKFYDNRPAGQEWHVEVLAATPNVLAGIYRISGTNGVEYYPDSGKTYTKIIVDKFWDVNINDWTDIITFADDLNVPLSFHRWKYECRFLISTGKNTGRYDVLSVTKKENGTITVVKLGSDLPSNDPLDTTNMECFFMRQDDDSLDGMGNVIAKNPDQSKYEIVSVGNVLSYLIAKST